MLQNFYKDHTFNRHHIQRYRQLPEYCTQSHYIDFSHNDYLCLSKNNLLMEAATRAGKLFGVGATGSRLLSGNLEIFQQLESTIAKDCNQDSALVFNSGFQANVFVLASLLNSEVFKKQPLVFFDRLNHSSLYHGIFLSKAELIRYRHNDIQHLTDLLQTYKNDPRPKFIVTETIFSMDGDVVSLDEIIDLSYKHNAFLYLDESHAVGMTGDRGYGLSTTKNLTHISHLIMGTFSKALGVSGGYITCSHIIKEYLVNFCPGFIYSTANSPMVIGAALKAWQLIPSLSYERQKIFELGKYMKRSLGNLGVNTGNSTTHIIPIIIGKEQISMIIQNKLLQQHDIMVSCIRPPSVPNNTSILRISINSSHNYKQAEMLLDALCYILELEL